MPDDTELLYEVSGNVATITLNRPDRMNAISIPMLTAFSQAFKDADADREVRAIILTGAGRGFCAGLDLKDVTSGQGIGGGGDGGGPLAGKFDIQNSPPVVLHTTDKPVI